MSSRFGPKLDSAVFRWAASSTKSHYERYIKNILNLMHNKLLGNFTEVEKADIYNSLQK